MSKIPQFRDVVRNVKTDTTFVGLDEDGGAIFDSSIPLPSIIFTGSIKLHGTNGSVCLHKGKVYAQSKSRIVTVGDDNFGFALFVEKNKEVFENMLQSIAAANNVDEESVLTLFGEFAGKGIQNGVGISNLDRSFFIFGCKVSDPQDEQLSYWMEVDSFSPFLLNSDGIYNLDSFTKHLVNVDFSSSASLGRAQQTFEKLTYEVEEECPVAKHLGYSGIGEGLVWTANHNGKFYRFKTKGEKHSSTKVKKLASVNVEKLEGVESFVEYASTENRFNQAIGEVFGKDPLDVKKLGELIKWVVSDISSEEVDTLLENGLEPKDVNKYIAQDVRQRFMEKLNNF